MNGAKVLLSLSYAPFLSYFTAVAPIDTHSIIGSVANDVETEQIVWEVTSSPNLLVGKFTAFVQRRGSVPLIWSQDPANRPPVVMGKPPPILLDINEPFATTAACHFRSVIVGQ